LLCGSENWTVKAGDARRITAAEMKYTGLFISPSGISDSCDTVAGMVTLKGSMSTDGETLQDYRIDICRVTKGAHIEHL
jgi:hypothetical protein